MDSQGAREHSAQVEKFRRQYRTELVALVFTDIVGSTQLKRQLGDQEGVAVIQQHHALVRELLAQFPEGKEVSTAGDSFFLVFVKPSDAVRFALRLQARMRAQPWPTPAAVADRIGIHVGEVVLEQPKPDATPTDFYGTHVDICSRVMSLAVGDQILLTRFAFDSARQLLVGPDIAGLAELRWLNHGPYQLAGFDEPLEICEVGEAGFAKLATPVNTAKAQRQLAVGSELVLGWRPACDQCVPNTQWLLEKKLGVGAFGEVWLGRHQRLEERRVFKFCFEAERAKSLKREVTLFRIIKEKIGPHPHIVAIQDVYFEEPPFYVVMDYADGKDLLAWCEERGGVARVPLALRLEIVAQVADALHAAHTAGVVHRDVKPSNILVSARSTQVAPPAETASSTAEKLSERPKIHARLADFGIGQVLSNETLASITKTDFTKTILAGTTSSKSGTQMYLAPELVAGRAASPQTDLYSLGVVLYQLAAGDLARPLATDWARDVANPLLRDDLTKCFAGNPNERFADASLLAQRLRALPERESARRRTATEQLAREKRTRRRATLFNALKFAGMLTLLLALGWLARERINAPVTSPASSQPKGLVVLPFTFTANDTSLQDLADGLTETIAAKLTRVQEFGGPFRIVPMTEVRSEKISSARGAREVFHAELVVNGSLHRVGDLISVTINLVDAQKLSQINSQPPHTFLPGDILELQDSASENVIKWLEPRALRTARTVARVGQTRVGAAYEAYVKGYGKLAKFERLENIEAAIAFFHEAINQDPHYALAEAALGEAYWRKARDKTQASEGQWLPLALEHSRHAVELADKLSAAHVTLGIVYMEMAQREKAQMEFQRALELDPKNPHAYRQLGRAYAGRGLLTNAVQTLQHAISLDTNYWGAYNELGFIYHFYFADYEKAALNFRRVIELVPDASLGYRNLGGALFSLGQYREADRLTRRSLEIHPSPEAYSNLGTICFFQSQLREAMSNYLHAVSLGKSDYVIFGNLADAFRVNGLTNQAQEAYRQALQLAEKEFLVHTNQTDTLASIAVFSAGLREKEKAIAAIDRALKISPGMVDIHFQAALVYELIGEREHALASLAAAVEQNYSPAEIRNHPDLTLLRQDQRFLPIKAKLDALAPPKTNQ